MLSFFSIFGIQNNTNWTFLMFCIVVNCFGYAESPCFPFARFHFSVSLGYKTTWIEYLTANQPLWIAFIFQYLWDTKQPIFSLVVISKGCELLSFFSIFGIQNNLELLTDFRAIVVNCFHFSVSLGYKTTRYSCHGNGF